MGSHRHVTAALPSGMTPYTQFTEGWSIPSAGQDTCRQSRTHPYSISGPSNPSKSLYGLRYLGPKEYVILPIYIFFLAQQPPVGQGLLIHEVSRSHTVGRTPLDEWSARPRDLYLTTHNTHNRQTSMPRWDWNPQSQQVSGRRPTPEIVRPLGPAYIYIYIYIYIYGWAG